MTLEAKDILMLDMIKENPDSTIKDYLELINELEIIESSSSENIGIGIRKRFLSLQHYLFSF